MFSKETYLQRRNQLKNSVKSGVLLFLGNNEAPMNYPSNTYRFRQDSHFLYFFGLQLDHLAAVIDADEDREILFGDDYTIDDIIWMGDQPSIQSLAERCGVAESRPFAALAEYLKKAQEAGRTIHFLPPYRHDNKILLHQLLGIPFEKLKESASVPMIKGVVASRERKTEEEIAEMEKICDLGVDMHLSAMRGAKAGRLERELAGTAEGISMSGGAGVSVPVILSQNGETLHNHNHEQLLENGRMLLVDAGDFSQGTPYFNLYRGRVEIDAMNYIGYDAATLGNHEFDNGLDSLAMVLKQAQFPIVCANYDFTGTPVEGLVRPYTIVKKGGLRVGIFGLGCNPKGIISDRNFEPAQYLEPYAVAQRMADTLRAQGCDVVVCLSHMGTMGKAKTDACDSVMVTCTRGIDVVIGGHTHKFYDKLRVANLDGDSIPLCQMGKSGVYLGKIVLDLSDKMEK